MSDRLASGGGDRPGGAPRTDPGGPPIVEADNRFVTVLACPGCGEQLEVALSVGIPSSSFEATRTVWTMRDAGELPGGPTLTVTLALADRADRRTNEVRTGVRGLAKRCGLAVGTVRDALVEAIGAGAVEVVEPGAGTRPTRYRLALSTARAEVVDDNSLRARHGAHRPGASARLRARLVTQIARQVTR